MYNRYVPQPDGTFQRNRLQDTSPEPPRTPEAPACWPSAADSPPQKSSASLSHGTGRPPRRPAPKKQPASPHCDDTSPGGFLRQLLPKDFSTEDLLVVILLLLMSGDCKEDQNMALLTLALYLFL